MATERPGAVTLDGTPLTLVGDEIRSGAPAPEFSVLSTTFQPISLASSAGKTRILLSLASIDTGVCDEELKEFSHRVSDLRGVEILAVSVDLPFAQGRWCATEGIDNVTLGSDHVDTSFGRAYGVLIKETRTLSRAAFVVNPAGDVTFVEYVREVGDSPDFDAITEAAKASAPTGR